MTKTIQQKRMRDMLDIVTEKDDINDIIKSAKVKGINEEIAKDALHILKRNGQIYQPSLDKFKITVYW